MQSKQGITIMGLFVLTALFYLTSGYLLGISNAELAGTGIYVATSYDQWIKFLAFLSGITLACGMMLFGVWIIEHKEKLIGSAKEILS